MTTRVGPAALVATVLATAARVTLGFLWIAEGKLKFDAGFGSADILLVAGRAATDTRVPGYFSWFARATLAQTPGLFGFAMPLLETAIGVALVLGVLTRVAALGSVLLLSSYWMADQLIAQYPIMLLLSVAVLLAPDSARAISLSALLTRRIIATAVADPTMHGGGVQDTADDENRPTSRFVRLMTDRRVARWW